MKMFLVIVASLLLTACGRQEKVEKNPLDCITLKIQNELQTTGKVDVKLVTNFKEEVLRQVECLEKQDSQQTEVRNSKIALLEKVEAVRLMLIIEPQMRRINARVDSLEIQINKLKQQ
ncbi:MAG: hypothetical protein RJA61_107 [Candidatus Parcubacteria bacterium]|jgi:outer membrane murein-binding lipoprotein Lpp